MYLSHVIKLGDTNYLHNFLSEMALQKKSFILSCISDSKKKIAKDCASHWSMLFVNNLAKQAYHLHSTHRTAFSVPEDKYCDLPCTQQRNKKRNFRKLTTLKL